jgi:hypothetical protein
MSKPKHWPPGGWYPRRLIVHQQKYRPIDSNKNVVRSDLLIDLINILCRTATECTILRPSEKHLIFSWFYHTIFKVLTTQILYPKCSITWKIRPSPTAFSLSRVGMYGIVLSFELQFFTIEHLKIIKLILWYNIEILSWSICF